MKDWICFVVLVGILIGSTICVVISPRDFAAYIGLIGAIVGLLAMVDFNRKAEVTCVLKDQGGHVQTFVFENKGNKEADDLHIQIQPLPGKSVPVFMSQNWDRVNALPPGQCHVIRIKCVITSGVEFDVTWSWNTGGKRKQTRQSRIALS